MGNEAHYHTCGQVQSSHPWPRADCVQLLPFLKACIQSCSGCGLQSAHHRYICECLLDIIHLDTMFLTSTDEVLANRMLEYYRVK